MKILFKISFLVKVFFIAPCFSEDSNTNSTKCQNFFKSIHRTGKKIQQMYRKKIYHEDDSYMKALSLKEENPKKAIELFYKVEKISPHSDASIQLALIYLFNKKFRNSIEDLKKSTPLAIEILLKKSKQNHPKAQILLADLYLEGLYIKRDLEKAKLLYNKSFTNSGSLEAAFKAYLMYKESLLKRDIRRSEELEKILIQKNYAPALPFLKKNIHKSF